MAESGSTFRSIWKGEPRLNEQRTGKSIQRSPINSNKAIHQFGTFSIVARDPELDELGLAVASRYFDAGYGVAHLKAGVGAVASQANVNAHLGPAALAALENGMTAAQAVEQVVSEDDGRNQRQLGIVDANGGAAAYTGDSAQHWAGHRTAHNVAVQGNILAGEAVVEAMLDAFQVTEGVLAERLLAALEAGEAAGGDSRGKQSAALYVVRPQGGFQGVDDRLVELKITDHSDPIPELRRLYNLWRYIYVVPAYSRLSDEYPELSAVLYEHIRRFLDQALAEDIDDAQVYNALAWYLAIKQSYPDDALRAAEKAYALAPADENVIDTLAEAHFAAGNVDEAVRWEQRALELAPDNVFFTEQLAKFRQAGG